MDHKIALSRLQRLSHRLNAWVLLSVVLLISNVLLASLCWYTAIHQRRTIVPVTITKALTVSDSQVDGNYLQAMALFFINQRLNVTPETIVANHRLLLSYTTPVFYHTFEQILAQETRQVKADKISSSFFIRSSHTYPAVLRVIVRGLLKRWVGERALESVVKTYVLTFHYHGGRLTVATFSELKGDPHASLS